MLPLLFMKIVTPSMDRIAFLLLNRAFCLRFNVLWSVLITMTMKTLAITCLLSIVPVSLCTAAPSVGSLSRSAQLLSHLDDIVYANNEDTTKRTSDINGFVFPETSRIILVGQSGQEIDIGEVFFSNTGDTTTGVHVEMNYEKFDDQFLSMRPFRCLTDQSEWFCYLPYPYEIKKTITSDKLTDLEYQLLFIWKSPKKFGIDAWNGVYYKLALNDDGTIGGSLLQGDLNVLANPPEPYSYPIDLNEFLSEGAKNRLFPELIIRP